MISITHPTQHSISPSFEPIDRVSWFGAKMLLERLIFPGIEFKITKLQTVCFSVHLIKHASEHARALNAGIRRSMWVSRRYWKRVILDLASRSTVEVTCTLEYRCITCLSLASKKLADIESRLRLLEACASTVKLSTQLKNVEIGMISWASLFWLVIDLHFAFSIAPKSIRIVTA